MIARTPRSRGIPEVARRVRRLRETRRIVHRWRELSAGARTIVACSGGADSTALLLALRSVTDDIVVAHIVHDMRPPCEAATDRDAVDELCHALGVPLHAEPVTRGPGNIEGSLRDARYDALADIAVKCDAPFVASGHHADDQLESMLMAMIRGAGPRGLSGAAPSRSLGRNVTLIRPMLRVTRLESEQICHEAGVEWIHDSTNDDLSRLRAAIRAKAIPDLLDIRPSSARCAARTAEVLRDAAGLVRDRATEVFADKTTWDRAALRAERRVVVGEGLRLAALGGAGWQGADRMPLRTIERVVDAIRDDHSETRVFTVGAGVRLEVRATTVLVQPEAAPSDNA